MALAKANLYQGSIRYCGDMMNFQKGKDSVHNEDLGYVMSIDGIRAISPAKDFITTIPVHHEKSLVDHEDKGSILVNGIVRKQEFDVSPILFEGQGDINRITNTHNQPFPLSGIFRNLPPKYQTK